MPDSEQNWTIITGSTGGLGSEIAKILAAHGVAMILINRSQAKAEAQRAELMSTHPKLELAAITADLMDTAQIYEAIRQVHVLPGRVDVLYNNSGVLTSDRVLSAQGLESQFAVNTLAAYLLIQGLRRKMSRPAGEPPAIVINFSSSAITRLKQLEVDNLPNPARVGGLMSTYAQTKLAVTALAPALAEDLQADNILIRAVDPGPTKSAMTTGGNSGMPFLLAWLAPLLFGAADKQAAKVVDAADPQAFGGRTGIYIANRKEKPLPEAAHDRKAAKSLIALLDRFAQTGP